MGRCINGMEGAGQYNCCLDMNKLQKYAEFMNLSFETRKQLVQSAKMLSKSQEKTPLKLQPRYEEQQFISLSVFDRKKTQTLYRLHTYRYSSTTPTPKAVLIYLHGLCAHMGHSAHLAQYLSHRGITTVGYDYRGFGKSEGDRGYIEDFSTHLSDAERFVSLVREVYPQSPIFVGGISLGGLTAYYLSLRHPEWFKGSVLLAPAIMPSISHSKWINAMVRLLGCLKFCLPKQLRVFDKSLEGLCRLPSGLQRIRKDDLYQKQRLKVSTVLTLIQAQQQSPQTFKHYRSPFLMVMGGRDKLIDPIVAFQLFQHSKTPQSDKDILFYDEMWHVIPSEPQFEQIQQKIGDWILQKR